MNRSSEHAPQDRAPQDRPAHERSATDPRQGAPGHLPEHLPEHGPGRPAGISLADLGWDDRLQAALAGVVGLEDPGLAPRPVPARVVRVDRGALDLLAPSTSAPSTSEPTGGDLGSGPARAFLHPRLAAAAAADPVATPCVGDWVLVRPPVRAGEAGVVEHLLPRRTAFVRATAGASSHGQVLAANADLAVVVEPLLPEPDLGRIERTLALAWESGATPLVVLTKADLVSDAEDVRADVAAAAPGVEVHAVSTRDGSGLGPLRALLGVGTTAALLGRSGAGKSSLTNALAGAEVMDVQAVRGDGKGRHTTVHRELVVLAGGGIVVDTPGLRGVGMTALEDDALERVFADVEALAAGCRFADCAHAGEPGCAVLAAVEEGELPERRLLSWRKLQREARWMAGRHDARLRAQDRARWKRVAAEARGRTRP